jgi:inner membrane protein
MSKSGHAITAFALGSVIFAAQPTIAGALTAVGAVAGASVPDSIEMPSFASGRRESVVPHRTWTHFWALWLLCAYFAQSLPAPWSHLLLGVALACALHILVDAFSPCGVPYLDPMKQVRPRVPLYRTGESSEIPIILIAFVIAGGAFLSRGPEMLHVFMRFI